MTYRNKKVAAVAALLKKRLNTLSNKANILKAAELKALYSEIPALKPAARVGFGREVNQLKRELQRLVDSQPAADSLAPIDVTAPFDVNTPADERPRLLGPVAGSRHPLTREIELISDIFYRMGFSVAESRWLDDDYHMFTSLNFPADHPARDDFDTFVTEEKDARGYPFVAPAHTSAMQNRLLKQYKSDLAAGRPIAVLVPGRVFRNEDLDARHEHTFYQIEGIYVDRSVNVGHLMATLKAFLQEYYQKDLAVKTQPYYFPFTEPSFEFAMSCPFCDQKGCGICSRTGWIEVLGCGLIHPNVLKLAGIDPVVYAGFAWGVGVDRLVMMKYAVEDVRHFHSGKLEFLRQFR